MKKIRMGTVHTGVTDTLFLSNVCWFPWAVVHPRRRWSLWPLLLTLIGVTHRWEYEHYKSNCKTQPVRSITSWTL